MAQNRRLFRFGEFELDAEAGELFKGGIKLRLQEQPMQALLLFLDQPGEAVSRQELKKRLWGQREYGDFDRGLNKVINRLRETLGDNADSPRYIETLPLRGYRFLAPVEIIQSAKQDGPPAAVDPPPGPKVPRWKSFAVIGAITAAALLLVAGWNTAGVRSLLFRNRPQVRSLAVLPFQNLTGDAGQEFFSDGMTDELIGELNRIESLTVMARASSMRFKGATLPISQIAKQLGVQGVVDGTIRRDGQKVQITARLIYGETNETLWSGKFERNVRDIMALQSEVAHKIAAEINVQLTPREQERVTRARQVDPKAHEAYLMGAALLHRGSEGQERSAAYFQNAIDLDPNYAPAYEGLAMANIYLGIFGLRPADDAYLRAEAAALKALELDDTAAGAQLVLAEVQKGFKWNWDAAGRGYRRALELSPNSPLAYAWYADYLSKIGHPDEAIEAALRASSLDPAAPARYGALGLMFYRAGRNEEAIEACHKAIEIDPNFPNAFWFLGLAYEQKQEFAKAITALEKAVSIAAAPLYRAQLGHAYGLAGESQKAQTVLAELKALSLKRYVSPMDFAVLYIGLGKRDLAFEWLERALKERTNRVQEVKDPLFRGLRGDPRFAEIVRRIGLPL